MKNLDIVGNQIEESTANYIEIFHDIRLQTRDIYQTINDRVGEASQAGSKKYDAGVTPIEIHTNKLLLEALSHFLTPRLEEKIAQRILEGSEGSSAEQDEETDPEMERLTQMLQQSSSDPQQRLSLSAETFEGLRTMAKAERKKAKSSKK
ncbi:MAG: hypothetical protein C0582_05485 [Alphaproteobacteria bacterium]|nr:MAG: hypothetical protein C0582_05485 [Alphaproteobacteria bacterium]